MCVVWVTFVLGISPDMFPLDFRTALGVVRYGRQQHTRWDWSLTFYLLASKHDRGVCTDLGLHCLQGRFLQVEGRVSVKGDSES